jgi:hypothetical protein
MSAVLESAAPVSAPRPRRSGSGIGELWRLTRADVRERTRRSGFLVSLLVMVWLAHGMMPPDHAGYRTFELNDLYRPAYGAAWVGALSAMLTTVYLMFVGFYLVKGSVERDRRTGVGQILAAARVGGLRYLFAKALSNVVVLMAMAAVVAIVALGMQQWIGEDRHVDLMATALPFLWLTLPSAMFVSACAVFFDCVSFLRGGLGNIVWFFLLGFILSSGPVQGKHASPFLDMTGGVQITRAALAANERAYPGTTAGTGDHVGMGVNINPRWKTIETIKYPLGPLNWDLEAMLPRALWMLISCLIVIAASLCFDRFDRAAAPFGRARALHEVASTPMAITAAAPLRAARRASELTVAPRSSGFVTLLRAEILLLLKGHSKWWYLGLLAALITGTFVPLRGAREFVLPIASLWPVLVWSALGHRERRDNVAPVLFSSPRPLGRLLLASWCAGTVLALVMFAPVLVRLAIAGEGAFLLGGIAGAAFIPALALASGVWTGSAKMFEALYLMLWYIGPMHHLPELDYTGVTIARPMSYTGVEFGVIAALLALAWIGRGRQLQN